MMYSKITYQKKTIFINNCFRTSREILKNDIPQEMAKVDVSRGARFSTERN